MLKFLKRKNCLDLEERLALLESKVKDIENVSDAAWTSVHKVIHDSELAKFYTDTDNATCMKLLESIAQVPLGDKYNISINGVDTLKEMCNTSSINGLYTAIFNSVGRKLFSVKNYTITNGIVNFEVVIKND